MRGDDFNLIAHADLPAIRKRDANVFFRSKFHYLRPRHIYDSWWPPFSANPLSADINNRQVGSRATDHRSQDRLSLLKLRPNILIPPIHGGV